jgi:DNA helicase-2/ATP-dependent DNA helicase PcrA
MLMLDACLSREEDERLKRNLQENSSSRRAEMGGTSVDPIVAYQIFYALAEASEGFLDLEDWFQRAATDQDISFFETSDQETSANDRVILSTVHGFKGKEKPVIFVLGPEGAMPDRRAKSEIELEEERRIAYVSVTRAREKLYFAASSQYSRELSWSQSGESWSQYRQKYGRKEPSVISSHQNRMVPSASTEKKPGTLDRILNWFLKLLDI